MHLKSAAWLSLGTKLPSVGQGMQAHSMSHCEEIRKLLQPKVKSKPKAKQSVVLGVRQI